MNKAQKVIVILLVVAIVFSVLTVVMTLSFGNFTSVKAPQPKVNYVQGYASNGAPQSSLEIGVLPPEVEE